MSCCSGELIRVDYLLSQNSGELQEKLGHDPDAPDHVRPDDLQLDEGEEDQREDERDKDPTVSFHSLEDMDRQPLALPPNLLLLLW